MDRMQLSVRRLAVDAMLLVFALMLSYLESLFNIAALIPIPGFKLGLANICIMLCLYSIGKADALVMLIARIALSTLLFAASPMSMLYSLSGGILSFLAMLALMPFYKNGKISLIGVSVVSAALHNTGQIAAACIMFGSFAPAHYLSYLIFIAIFTGLLTGYIANLFYNRVAGIKKY